MEATTRIRLFNTRSADEEEGRGAPGTRRRVDSVGRGRRRRHNRAPKPRLFFGVLPTRRAMLLLLLVAGAAGPFVSLRLLAWASTSMPREPAGGNSGGGIGGGGGGLKVGIQDKPPSVSLGPDSIPSVVRIKRRASLSALPGLPGPAHPGRAQQGLGEEEDSSPPRTSTLSGGESAAAGGEEKPRDVCRSTVQGVALLADSEGRVCRRAELDHRRPGCCNALPLSSAGGDLPGGAVAEAIASMDGYAIQDVPPLSPPPRASMSLRADVQRKEAGGAREEGNTPLTAAAGRHLAGRQVAGRRGEAKDGVPPEEALSTAFSCWSCDAGESGGSSCCASYEFCVSCCQDPRRKEEREAIQAAAAVSGHPAYAGLGFGGGGGGSDSKAVGIEKVSPPALPLEGGGGQLEGGRGRVEGGGGVGSITRRLTERRLSTTARSGAARIRGASPTRIPFAARLSIASGNFVPPRPRGWCRKATG